MEFQIMKEIDLKEVQKHALAIAKEFDIICSRHSIPYYMLGGTMLGAIRHKGFIPWDDDMDFGVPIKYFDELIICLERELPYPYRCCTYKNHPAVLHNFLKIEDQTTYVDDIAIELPIEKKLGINIDVFPLNYCTLGGGEEKRLRRRFELLGKVYLHSVVHKDSKMRSFIKHCLRNMIGNNPQKLQDDIEKRLRAIDTGNYLGNLLGRWGDKEIVPTEWYGSGVRYQFEDTSFVGLKQYDAYLSRLYGDYMTPPSESGRVPHVTNVFIK